MLADDHLQQIDIARKCRTKQISKDKSVCVCNAQFCDNLDFEWPNKPRQVTLVESSQDGLRFRSSDLSDHFWNGRDRLRRAQIGVDLHAERQSILGWGGAFTDATGININSLSPQVGEQLIESYFGEKGLRYNFGRVPIGGSDFSARPYTYDDSNEPDYELKKWFLAEEDLLYKIPIIRRAKEIANRLGTKLNLISSPWSPPAWMKTNKNLTRGSLIDEDRIYRSYVNYLMKFYDAYGEKGIEFWGATIQNEPVAANLPFYFFNSLQFGNSQMAKFVSKYLGPALEARGWTRDNFKLNIGDDSLGLINMQVPSLMRNPEVSKYISGLAFHWYTSGLVVPYSALTKVYDAIKHQIEFVIMTEACTGTAPARKRVDLGNWTRGELYTADIIEDLNRHTSAWIDWNMALDLQGGANWSKNFVDSPIIVNAEKDEFYKQPMYYALAHFSRLFGPGSVLIESKVSLDGYQLTNKFMAAVVHNKESGHLIINILNKSDRERKVEVTISNYSKSAGGFAIKPFVVRAKSISSVVLKL